MHIHSITNAEKRLKSLYFSEDGCTFVLEFVFIQINNTCGWQPSFKNFSALYSWEMLIHLTHLAIYNTIFDHTCNLLMFFWCVSLMG